jgi:hypothetical protein
MVNHLCVSVSDSDPEFTISPNSSRDPVTPRTQCDTCTHLAYQVRETVSVTKPLDQAPSLHVYPWCRAAQTLSLAL